VITAERLYEPNPELQNYYQGDILSGIPFPTLPTFLPATKQDVWGILRPRPARNRPNAEARPIAEILRNLPNDLIGRAAKDIPDAWTRPEGEYIIAACRKMTVLMVSRSCDMDKDSRKHYLVAPVVAIDSLREEQRTEEKLRDLRANKIFHWFYLPEKPPSLPESYADLAQMLPLHKTFFDDATLRASLVTRLSPVGTISLQSSLSSFYGIKFGFAPEDICPQTGRYACSSCFHSGRPAPYSRDFKAGNVLGDCGFCREEAMWVKVPEAG
jgi:hypothetical protein